MRRYVAHIAVMLLVALTLVEWHVPPTLAGQPQQTQPPTTPQPAPILARSDVSQRLATPAPIDLEATPLPTPLPTAIPWGSPLPAPTAGWVQPIPATVGTHQPITWPVSGPITTPFSAAHPAVDIGAPCGTPVVAPMAGTVTWAGWRNDGGGYVLDITSAIGRTSLNHLSGYAVTGGDVASGQIVAYVGSTGNSTGCHVHWALWRDGWRNPLP